MIVDKIALILIIIGALNWGAVGLFSFDAVAWISGGATTLLARIIYSCSSCRNLVRFSFVPPQ